MRTVPSKMTSVVLTDSETQMALRVGSRAAQAVRDGAAHLDAITTQMQASGVDTWDPSYMLIGRLALKTLLAEVPLWKAPAKGSHTAGWTEFTGSGEPSGSNTEDEEEGSNDSLEGFQIKQPRQRKV